MKKITFTELCEKFYKHNEENGVTSQFADKKALVGVVVFKQESWPDAKEEYALESRSYALSSDNKFFVPGMGGNSIYADCLDGTDRGVRLDWYLRDWKIDYCYIKEDEQEGKK